MPSSFAESAKAKSLDARALNSLGSHIRAKAGPHKAFPNPNAEAEVLAACPRA